MSHNWRHYSKKIKLSDSKDTKSITTFFKKKNVGLNQSCSASVSSTATVSLCESETEPEGTTEVTSSTVDDVDIVEKSENLYTLEKHDSHMDSDNRSISVNITANDMRKFNLAKYETKFPWLFHSAVHRGYMCKYCELFAPKLDKSTPYVTCGAILGTHPTRRLEMHQSSETHLKSTTRYTSSLCNVSVAKLALNKLKTSQEAQVAKNRAYIMKLFQTCGFMVQKKWALAENFQDQVAFMGRVCDPDITEVLKSDITYTCPPSAMEIAYV
ncbi:hypothetical protein ACF0H5_000549 [Mactra antiquata]